MPFGSMPHVQNSTTACLTLKEDRSKRWLLSKGLTTSEGVSGWRWLFREYKTTRLHCPAALGLRHRGTSLQSRIENMAGQSTQVKSVGGRSVPHRTTLCITSPGHLSLAILGGGAPAFNLGAWIRRDRGGHVTRVKSVFAKNTLWSQG